MSAEPHRHFVLNEKTSLLDALIVERKLVGVVAD